MIMLAAFFFLFLIPLTCASPVARQEPVISFNEPTNVTTCSTVSIVWAPPSDPTVTFNVTVTGVNTTTPVSFTLTPAPNATSVSWTAAVPPGQYELGGQVATGESLKIIPTEFVVTPGNTSCLQPEPAPETTHLAAGTVAGIVIGALVALALLAAWIYFRARVRRSQREAQLEMGPSRQSRQSTIIDITARAPTPIFRAPTPRAPIMADELQPETLQKVLNKLK